MLCQSAAAAHLPRHTSEHTTSFHATSMPSTCSAMPQVTPHTLGAGARVPCRPRVLVCAAVLCCCCCATQLLHAPHRRPCKPPCLRLCQCIPPASIQTRGDVQYTIAREPGPQLLTAGTRQGQPCSSAVCSRLHHHPWQLIQAVLGCATAVAGQIQAPMRLLTLLGSLQCQGT